MHILFYNLLNSCILYNLYYHPKTLVYFYILALSRLPLQFFFISISSNLEPHHIRDANVPLTYSISPSLLSSLTYLIALKRGQDTHNLPPPCYVTNLPSLIRMRSRKG